MEYGDILAACPKGVHHFDEKDFSAILKLYPRMVVDGREMFRWCCIGAYCKDYIECYSKAYLESIKQ
jgi:hypothetical protein